jgi:hypothetical protein
VKRGGHKRAVIGNARLTAAPGQCVDAALRTRHSIPRPAVPLYHACGAGRGPIGGSRMIRESKVEPRWFAAQVVGWAAAVRRPFGNQSRERGDGGINRREA